MAHEPIRIRFLGDISFNDEYVSVLESGHNPFSGLSEVLTGADLVVGNLECLAQGKAENLEKKPRLKTTLKALDALRHLNLGLVSLATNHYYDNLEEGFERTIGKLRDCGIATIGAAQNPLDAQRPFIWEGKQRKVGFLNYVHSDTNPNVPEKARVYANEFDMKKIVQQIKELKDRTDHMVVLLHWGGKCDYGYFPHKEQIAQAKAMIEAGADAVVGHHTHTFQASMRHKGKPIFFSLGNFCFADIHSDNGIVKVRNSGRKSAVLELTFMPGASIEEKRFGFRINGTDLNVAPSVVNEFARWTGLFWLVRTIPGLYAIYYYLLRRWEPVHFHAQLHETTLLRVGIRKFKRIFGLA